MFIFNYYYFNFICTSLRSQTKCKVNLNRTWGWLRLKKQHFAIKKPEAIINFILFGGRYIDSFAFHHCSLFLFVSTPCERYIIGQRRHSGHEWSHARVLFLSVFSASRERVYFCDTSKNTDVLWPHLLPGGQKSS